MTLYRRTLLGAAASTTLVRSRASAQSPTIRIGVLNDQSGLYRDDGGPTSAICARQAVEEFRAANPGINVELIVADHQNKPDIGAGIARQWFDQGDVDAVVDVPTSSVALAVNTVCREKNKVMLNSGAATTDLTGAQCSPNTVHWTYDTYMLAKSTGGATVRSGGDTWFFITANYVFGQQLQRDTARFVTAAGGRVLGAVAYPFPETTDFSSMLLQAQASRAKVLALCNSGGDTINCIKQAREFGLTKTMRVAAMLMYNSNVHALGQDVAQGLVMTETFYWDLNDRTRAFMDRIRPKTPNQWPNMVQAGCYSAVLHYLKAVADMGPAAAKADGRAVVARMKAMPTDDDCFGPGRIREDGRKLHPAYLLEAKKPSDSKGPWDGLKLVATTPADEAFRPLSEGGCALIKT
ncbi:ABC transporter substrate-binding protein [Paracraurococcus lichenis]|uniref:ABC transporter substrate-binding protein n=1 Tax=Paracraurococcus lichenis TaxID=3064888 RepID=A0ABT9E9A4_9PROT|nr:ABC transporter substrate-binding protein [Paracraurococcus sp. LOR1-02]MDO9712679.1 ABC transporter substrate-binding protein [Paracraurococcus sp. LOR1-02]